MTSKYQTLGNFEFTGSTRALRYLALLKPLSKTCNLDCWGRLKIISSGEQL